MKIGTISLGNASLHLGHSQVVPPTLRGHAREITEFNVPEKFRGKGEGTELLKEVCEQADNDKILLILKADTERLENYYKRFDFITFQRDNAILMARKPKI